MGERTFGLLWFEMDEPLRVGCGARQDGIGSLVESLHLSRIKKAFDGDKAIFPELLSER
jgi:hypothetical protein